MFIEFVVVDWRLISANFLWILGAAIILITLSYHEFLASQKKIKFWNILMASSFKKYSILGLTLIALGLFFSPISSGGQTSSKFFFIDYNVFDSEKIKPVEFSESINFTNNEMEMNTKNPAGDNLQYPIENGLIVMPWNGYVGTPFIKLHKGNYIIEFEARGSRADNEFAKIFVFLVALKKRMLAMQKLFETKELSETMKTYSLKFEVEKETVGKIRIQFFNDGGDERAGDRNVWISGMKIHRINN